MPKDLKQKESLNSLIKKIFDWGVLLFGGVGPLFHHLREDLNGQLDIYALRIEKRLTVLALYGFTFFLALFSIWIGFLFIAIDNAGVSRGIACLGGGLLMFVFFVLLVQFTKQKGSAT